jgi:DNA polymerase-1
MKDPLYLLDSYSLIYRSYFAFIRRPLRNAEGRNTSAIFGFFRTLFSLFAERRPAYFAAVFDSTVPTFRHLRYEAYKATRDKTPDDLHAQVPVVNELLEALGIPMLGMDGFEADDLIATFARKCTADGRRCYVISGDKDLLQLVDASVSMLRPEQGGYREITGAEVIGEWGVTPGQIVDYLALTGDSSDNVPGVPGIGDKTAVKLLSEFGTLDAIYERLEEVSSESLRRKLTEGRESAFLSKELVTLRFDVPLPVELDGLRLPALDAERAVPIFMREGIRSLADELVSGKFEVKGGGASDEAGSGEQAAGTVSRRGRGGKARGKEADTPELGFEDADEAQAPQGAAPVTAVRSYVTAESAAKGEYGAVTSLDELDRWLDLVRQSGRFAFDCETDSLDAMVAKPVGFSLSVESGKACYVPLVLDGKEVLPADEVRSRLTALFGDASIRTIGQNIKYDYKVLARWGVKMKNVAFDTMIAAWLLESDQIAFNLEKLAAQYLGYEGLAYEDVVPKGATFDTVPLETATAYAAEDADITFRLYELFDRLLAERGFAELFAKIEMPLLVRLAEMELTGIRLDAPVLERFSHELDLRLTGLEDEIYRLCGRSFNIGSTKQLQEVLFVERKLKTGRRTKTGYSTDVTVLEELAREDPVPAKILDHRLLSKLKSTYVTALPRLVNPETGRLHTTFIQTGTATGRLASRDPNLQNIPIRDDDGRRIRSAFIPEPGTVFMSADYSQIELVVLAHLTGDPGLTEAFRNGEDVHRRTAAILFGVEPAEVTPEQRRIAKTINFGVMYGMSAFRLSRDLGIPRAAADQFIDAYFTRYSRIRDFIDRTVKEAERDGCVRTIFGRERKIPAITSRNKTEKMAAERIAVNTPIQGSAADIMKIAMIRVAERLETERCRSRLLLQVHDELILEVPKDEAAAVERLLREEMEHAVELTVPLRVNIETGSSWGELH